MSLGVRRCSISRSVPILQHPQPLTNKLSPPHPVGVVSALQAAKDGFASTPHPTLLNRDFALTDRVGIVTGGNRGLNLEFAMTLLEAGARAIYCFDLPKEPSEEWKAVRDYVARMDFGNGKKGGRLEYVCADVRDQNGMWEKFRKVGDDEGRMDICIAGAGVLEPHTHCLEFSDEQVKKIYDVNVSGMLFTAQAAGQQMVRFETPGSVILVASQAGSLTNRDHAWIAYNSSKSAVLQMTRSMACELGPKGIRVNSISPGYIYTTMTSAYFDKHPHLLEATAEQNPLGRLGRPDELRGVVAWLASDASTFCTGSDILVTGGHHAW